MPKSKGLVSYKLLSKNPDPAEISNDKIGSIFPKIVPLEESVSPGGSSPSPSWMKKSNLSPALIS